jgi:hypothetical protein
VTEIEVGRWYRWTLYNVPVKVTGLTSPGLPFVVGLDGRERAPVPCELTPWSPEVGEWVRFGKVSFQVNRLRGGWAFGDDLPRGGECGAFSGVLEPCSPPVEAKPSRAAEFVREASVEAIVEAIIADRIPERGKWKLSAELGPKPVGHDDPTCKHCGASTYTGLEGRDHACPPLEPAVVTPTALRPGRWCDEANHRVGREVGFKATGHGHSAIHPTREGAVAMWRDAVKRCRGGP